MTRSSKTDSYCVTFEVHVRSNDFPEIERRMECARQIYNTCLGRCLKLWNGIKGDPHWQKNLKELLTITRKSNVSKEETLKQKELKSNLRKIELDTGFSEYALHAYALNVNRHFGNPLGSNELQKAATFAWRTFERLRFGNAKKVKFKRYGDPITVENKVNSSGLRLKGTTVLWGNKCARTLVMPIIINKNDKYAEQTFLDKTKYIRIFFRDIRGERRLFIQAVKEGTPPAKGRTIGRSEDALGIDLSPSTVVAWTKGKAVIEEMAPDCDAIEQELRRINRAIDRSRRATNPNAFNEDGTIKCGVAFKVSNRCRKLLARRKELFRKQSALRKQAHERTANRLIALSGDIKVEDTPVTSWVRKAKKVAVNRKNGRIRSKKRFGKTVARRAPAMLLSIIDRKLHYAGQLLQRVDSFKVKASQYDHSTGQCAKKRLCDRWAIVDGRQVQRDLYSAFLIAHVTGKELNTIDREACNADWMNFLVTQDEALRMCDKSLGIF